MKWYKHISDSLDDPFINELLDEFGSDGYMVFFGILEIYSREFKPENGWKLDVTLSYFHRKLRISPSKLKKILSKIWKWEITYFNNRVCINIPKFKDLTDNWTSRQIPKEEIRLRSNNVETTQPIRIKNKEEEEDKDIKAKERPVDNFIEQENKDAFLNKLKPIHDKVKEIYPRFNIQLFIQNNIRKNPKALIHTLQTLITQNEKGIKIENPAAWCETILKSENMNYNARDSESLNNHYKKQDLTMVNAIFNNMKMEGM